MFYISVLRVGKKTKPIIVVRVIPMAKSSEKTITHLSSDF